MDCRPKLKDKNNLTALTHSYIYCNDKHLDIINKLFTMTIDKDNNKENYISFSFATKYSNKKILNNTIINLYSYYNKHNKFIDNDKCYLIDYLVKRIYECNLINYNKFIINDKKMEIDIYYLLSFLNKIHNKNYQDYCSDKSEEFINDILNVKEKKDAVLNEILYMPPIDNIFCGGSEYFKSFESFTKIAYY
jgi:hypothetical protein